MKTVHHIRVPFPTPAPPKDALYKFKFQTPTSIKLVGSYALKSAAKHPTGITIDVSVLMPDVCPLLYNLISRIHFRKRTTSIIDISIRERVTSPLSLLGSKIQSFLSK